MSKSTIHSILQLMAVATILIGLIMLAIAMLGYMSFQQALNSFPNGPQVQLSATASSLGFYGIVAAAMPAFFGIGLLAMSRQLAANIHRRSNAS